MRTLLLFRGAPGCGKSTFIKEKGLEQYTLSADNIRLMCQAPIMNIDGSYSVSLKNDNLVWELLFNMLELRMKRGEFVVIDATNSSTREMSRYKHLAELYRYRVLLVDMTNIPIEVAKERNANRLPKYKRVPERVIDGMYERFESHDIPGFIQVIKPKEFDESIKFNPIDLNKYSKIHHIGDIHGCYTALMEYIGPEGIKDDEYYIFCGDYLDRGIENVETLEYIMSIANKKNVLLLTGNHERHIWDYAKNTTSVSEEFEKFTKPQLDKAGISKKEIRKFYRKLAQVAYYTYQDKTVFVSHGGIATMPDNLRYLATEHMIKGVGDYDQVDISDRTFDNTSNGIYQIHGHRNMMNSPIKVNNHCFNLEGEVEFGGHLRIVTLDRNGFETYEIQNNVFKIVEYKKDQFDNVSNEDAIKILRENNLIMEKPLDNNISSFNFKTEAFKKGIWNEQTIRARGLYFNTETNDIVIRSYNKFFNINENEITKMANLKRIMKFPVTVYKKYNGYLGLIGYDKKTDDFVFASKSSTKSDHALWLKELFNENIDETSRILIKEFLKQSNTTLVFEVIKHKEDPHIIKYEEDNLILLNVVRNTLAFEQLPYVEVQKIASILGTEVKEKATTLDSWESFMKWYNEITDESYKYKGEDIEGFVVEDSQGFMTKIKLYYYNYWKALRGLVKETKQRGYSTNYRILDKPGANKFYKWLLSQDKSYLDKEIIELRELYFKGE